jgi:iron complex transport system permease protein
MTAYQENIPAAGLSSQRETGLGFRDAYRVITARRRLLLALLFLAAGLSVVADIAVGPSTLSLAEILTGIFDSSALSPADSVILWDIRLPYALMAVCVGGALGLAGAETQTVLGNPLASPYTLGISWAAILGATLVIVMDVSLPGTGRMIMLPLGAFIAAALASLLILGLATRFGSNTETIILFGIALLFSCTALIQLLQFVAEAEDLQESVLWSIGSLTRSTWPSVFVVFATLMVVTPLTLRSAWALTLLRGGDEHAKGAGVSLQRIRLAALMRSSLLAAVAVSFVGAIGFVGLVAPHIARLLLGEDQRFFLPGSLVAGALMLSLASIASKLILPGVIIPVGIVTSLVGIPVFVALVVLRRRGG